MVVHVPQRECAVFRGSLLVWAKYSLLEYLNPLGIAAATFAGKVRIHPGAPQSWFGLPNLLWDSVHADC